MRFGQILDVGGDIVPIDIRDIEIRDRVYPPYIPPKGGKGDIFNRRPKDNQSGKSHENFVSLGFLREKDHTQAHFRCTCQHRGFRRTDIRG